MKKPKPDAMLSYIGLIDGVPGAYGIHFPDLPGCAAMAATVEAVIVAGADVMRDWAETTQADGRAVPAPRPFELLRTDPDVIAVMEEGALLAVVSMDRPSRAP